MFKYYPYKKSAKKVLTQHNFQFQDVLKLNIFRNELYGYQNI